MSLLQNTVVYFYLILCFLCSCSFAFPVPTDAVAEVLKLNSLSYIMMALRQPIDSEPNNNGGETKHRVKRAGKFSDSAKMSPTKVMQLWLQMIKNLVSNDPVGGVHPMSASAVRPVVKLFKQRIIDFFFPDVGNEKV